MGVKSFLIKRRRQYGDLVQSDCCTEAKFVSFFFFAIQIMTRAAMTACCVVCARRLVRFCSLDIKYFPAESSARASSHGCQRES